MQSGCELDRLISYRNLSLIVIRDLLFGNRSHFRELFTRPIATRTDDGF